MKLNNAVIAKYFLTKYTNTSLGCENVIKKKKEKKMKTVLEKLNTWLNFSICGLKSEWYYEYIWPNYTSLEK